MTKRRKPAWAHDPWQWGRFYYNRYLTDPGLIMCSDATQGIWMRMLCHMWASSEQGTLLIGSRAMTEGEMAKLLGRDKRTINRVLEELTVNNVLSRDERGAVFCRRMRRSSVSQRTDAENGRRGGNPYLLKNKVLVPKRVNPRVKADSDSDSDSDKKGRKRNPSDSPASADAAAARPTEPPAPISTNVVPWPIPAAGVALPTAPPPPPAAAPAPPPPRKAPNLTSGSRRGRDARGEGVDELHAIELAALAAYDRLAAVSNLCERHGQLDADERKKLRFVLRTYGIGDVHKALAAAEESPLWQGRAGQGWSPCFRDFVSPVKFKGLLEGRYADTAPRLMQAQARPAPSKLGHIAERLRNLRHDTSAEPVFTRSNPPIDGDDE